MYKTNKQQKNTHMVPEGFVKELRILVRWNINMQNKDKWQFQMALWLETFLPVIQLSSQMQLQQIIARE